MMNSRLPLPYIDRIESMSTVMTISELAAEVFGVAGPNEIEEMAAICARNGIIPRVRRPEVVTITGTARKKSLANSKEPAGLPKAPARNDLDVRLAAGRTAEGAGEAVASRVSPALSGKSLDSDEVLRTESGAPTYRLRNPSGSYLNRRQTGMTEDKRFAWCGTAEDVDRVLFEKMRSTVLIVEPVI